MTQAAPIALPYRFGTSDVWHTILKGAFGLNVLLLLSLVFAIFARPWPVTLGIGVMELTVLGRSRRVQVGPHYGRHAERRPLRDRVAGWKTGDARRGPRTHVGPSRPRCGPTVRRTAPPSRGGDRRAHRDSFVMAESKQRLPSARAKHRLAQLAVIHQQTLA